LISPGEYDIELSDLVSRPDRFGNIGARLGARKRG
jgi:hypothetical protein